MKSSKKRSNIAPVLIGLTIVAAIAVVFVLKSPKRAGTGSDTSDVFGPVAPDQLTVTPSELAAVTLAPANAQSAGSATPRAEAAAPPKVEATATARQDQPFPSSPAAQIDWIARNQKPAMILFHSTTCKACKIMDGLVEKVRTDYEPRVFFIHVITNNRSNSGLVQQAGIRLIPTSFFVQGSGTGKRFVGALEEDALRAELDQLLAGG